jgi:2-polyprenyl-3-methyl-5-hydroxy-6-metoxy-1,4-benzoquinol methylase
MSFSNNRFRQYDESSKGFGLEIIDVQNCYACGSANLEKAFAHETLRHSSLMRVKSTDLSPVSREVQNTFSKPNWTICAGCGLIFAGHRPGEHDTAEWYLDLFKLSEERGYDVTPLPPAYATGKAASGKKLFELLSTLGVIKQGASVLHVRCATGTFLEMAQLQSQCEVAGLDFFGACVQHANTTLGAGVVQQMSGPQPQNPFPERRYDLIVANHMLTHAHNPAKLVQNFRKWLKPEGVLVVLNEPDHQKTLGKLKAYPRGINFFHKQLFSEQTFRSAMAQWGFALERVQDEKQPKLARNMMYVCRQITPVAKPSSTPQASRKLLRGWAMRRRFAEFLGLVKAG